MMELVRWNKKLNKNFDASSVYQSHAYSKEKWITMNWSRYQLSQFIVFHFLETWFSNPKYNTAKYCCNVKSQRFLIVMNHGFQQNVIFSKCSPPFCATAQSPSKTPPPSPPWCWSAWAWSLQQSGGHTPNCAHQQQEDNHHIIASNLPDSKQLQKPHGQVQGSNHCLVQLLWQKRIFGLWCLCSEE